MKLKVVILIIGMLIMVSSTLFFSEETAADWRYTVRRGDTLFRVARKTGVSVKAIKNRNGLRLNRLRIGQRIIIPSGVARQSKSRKAGVRNTGELELLARAIHAEA
ncbi:MAG TPA: LysM peptidoglycan-binding domain-containing protein, partial [Bacillota bacterium]|nr:LysM peptidoglycan-binding domain-containing protein [Bacillota bacterium]